MDELFRTGYVGGSVAESTEWIAEKSQGAKIICVPFAGIGRSIVAMANPETAIESWDTMLYAEAIIDGVFKAKEAKTNVDGLHYRKGWVFENRPWKHIDDRSAGFIDWVAQEGTLYDKACIGSAIVRSTLMARMMQWRSNVEGLYTRFQKQFEYNQNWLNQPGEYLHHHADFYNSHAIAGPLTEKDSTGPNSVPAAHNVSPTVYDLVEIDPPKIVNYSDVYSLHFSGFNSALMQQKVTLPKWSRKNALRLYRQALQVPAPRVIFMYTSRTIPTIEQIRKMLEQEGTIVEEQEFEHQGRIDYGILLEREVKT